MSDVKAESDGREVLAMHPPRPEGGDQGAADIPLELIRALAVLAEPPGPEHASIARVLGLPGEVTPAGYSDVFLFQLYPYASVHLGPEGMMGGEARDRVAGFWSALRRTPPAEPDHLAALLGLYASLADEATDLPEAEASLAHRALRALLVEHIAPWAIPYLRRLRALSTGVYVAWADVTAAVLEAEVRREGRPDGLPAHLRDAPQLPDPREEGARAFLEGLLAPVRTGTILTRADLATMARRLDIGLRAGERRYALEHLLAQSAGPMLGEIAAACESQAIAHRADSTWLGDSADFFAERAESTARLLRVLASAPELMEGDGPTERSPAGDP